LAALRPKAPPPKGGFFANLVAGTFPANAFALSNNSIDPNKERGQYEFKG
jgi:hypothetical protein